jgi:gluconolactonase
VNIERIAGNLGFPEGPVAMDDGSVLFVEIRNQCLSRIDRNGVKSIVAELGGGPNGAAIGPDGAVYVANNGGFTWTPLESGELLPHGIPDDYVGGSIQRVDLNTGKSVTLYTECEGVKLKGPNDLVFDQYGGFYFTDFGKATDEWRHFGDLYYARADGSLIAKVRAQLWQPNGVGLSPDGKTVYVAEAYTSRLWGFDIIGPGVLVPPPADMTPGRHIWSAPGYRLLDSLAVEAGGNVCIATVVDGGVSVVSPAGDYEHVPVPAFLITNICFGGEDMRTTWITAGLPGQLFKARWPREGLRLNYNA